MTGYNYSHPNNEVRRECLLINQTAASATAFAAFRTRQKSVVTAIDIVVKSASSADERFYVTRNRATIATLTPATGGSAGSLPTTLPTRHVITLTASNTLASIGDVIELGHDNTAGVYDVVYSYRVLFDNDNLMSHQ